MRQLGFADHLVSGLDQAVQALSYVRTHTYGILAVPYCHACTCTLISATVQLTQRLSGASGSPGLGCGSVHDMVYDLNTLVRCAAR